MQCLLRMLEEMDRVINSSHCIYSQFHSCWSSTFNTWRLRQNGCHFPYNIFTCIFLNENVWILLKISNSLKFVPMVQINNIPALVQIMAWYRQGDKPLSEPMKFKLLMYICISQPQWVKEPHHQLEWYYSKFVQNITCPMQQGWRGFIITKLIFACTLYNKGSKSRNYYWLNKLSIIIHPIFANGFQINAIKSI